MMINPKMKSSAQRWSDPEQLCIADQDKQCVPWLQHAVGMNSVASLPYQTDVGNDKEGRNLQGENATETKLP